jgi:hypothetical protein
MRTFNMARLGGLISLLETNGVASANIPNVLSALALNSPNATITAALNAILANSNSPAVISDEAKKIAETPNAPASVIALLPSLAAATTPVQVVGIVQEMEAALQATAPSLLGGFGTL